MTSKEQTQQRTLTPFHVSATGHSLNYLPEYIASRHGFFADEGLSVTVSVPQPWDLVLSEIRDNANHSAALGGIWVPSMYLGRCGGARRYKAFAQMSNRSPLALVKRCSAAAAEVDINGNDKNGTAGRKDGRFDFSELVGRTVLLKSGNGASVGLSFKMVLREHGVDPGQVHFVQDLDGAMLGELFSGGMGDYFFVDIITARIMEAGGVVDGCFRVVWEMAADEGPGGDIPWSVYYSEETTGEKEAYSLDVRTRFCAALCRAMAWINERDARTFAEGDLAHIFPGKPLDVLVDITNLYRKVGMWTSPTISRHGFARWQKGIADGKLVNSPLAYEDVVDDRASEAARKEFEGTKRG